MLDQLKEDCMNLDIDKAQRGMKNITVRGVPRGRVRLQAIADAIAAIQTDGATALLRKYIGVKNYAAFGDQREDHEHGYGPRHGHIVFRITRGSGRSAEPLGENEVYLLEAVRDFGVAAVGDGSKKVDLNLCDVLDRLARAETEADDMRSLLARAVVESHAAKGAA